MNTQSSSTNGPADDLRNLEQELAAMGAMVIRAVADAFSALCSHNLPLAQRVVRGDQHINERRYQIEDHCLAMLTVGGLSAKQVREVLVVHSVVADLERIGDHAEGIANVALMLGKERTISPSAQMVQMGEMVQNMLARGVQALRNPDFEEGRQICAADDEVDEAYEAVYHELLAVMFADRATVAEATYLLWATHNLERIADRVTNIGERVAFLVTGRMQELNVSKY
jgi:phosphate transport system protein